MVYTLADFIEPIINFYNSIDSSTKVLGAIFIISFILLNFLFSKTFKENPATGKILSFIISFLVVYLLNLTGINYGYTFGYLGYDTGIALPIMNILLIAGIIFILWKVGISNIFLFFGAILTFGSLVDIFFFDIIYSPEFFLIIGIPMLILGLYLWNRRRKIAQGIERKNVGVGTAIKVIIFAAGIFALFYNTILAGIIFILWLLVLFISYQRHKKQYPNRFYNKKIGSVKGMGKGIWGGIKKGGGYLKDKYRDRKIRKLRPETEKESKKRIEKQEKEKSPKISTKGLRLETEKESRERLKK